MSRFTLEKERWYACEFIGDEFAGDKCSHSPIRILDLKPHANGRRRFDLKFYHANYPAGVREKVYQLKTIERGTSFLLARTVESDPVRFLQIHEISAKWLETHFPGYTVRDEDLQNWLGRNL